jgi:hypothetical protein
MGPPPHPASPSPTSAAAAADAARAAEEDEWLTRSGRRSTKRQSLKMDCESAVSELIRGTTLRCVNVWMADCVDGWMCVYV